MDINVVHILWVMTVMALSEKDESYDYLKALVHRAQEMNLGRFAGAAMRILGNYKDDCTKQGVLPAPKYVA